MADLNNLFNTFITNLINQKIINSKETKMKIMKDLKK